VSKHRSSVSARMVVAIVLVVVVLSVVIIGITLLDSPAEARLRRLDERRIADLREIAYAVDAYWTRERVLPPSLEELSVDERILRELADPETGTPYEYRVISEDTYELCAVFASAAASDDRDPFHEDLWFRGPGRQCFRLKAGDAERPLER